jgi:hypothetical protein
MKNIIITIIIVALIAIGFWFFTKSPSNEIIPNDQETENQENINGYDPEAIIDESKSIIGESVEKRTITAYHYGTGDTELLFIGGIHGGYEWNTTLVAYELMDYLEANPEAIPQNIKVTVIPVLNPDGLFKTVGTTDRFSPSDVPSNQSIQVDGRFNANNVDLNRNFDCDWQAKGEWQDKVVDGGASAFSEPESQALKNYVNGNKPNAVVVWYSAVGGVFASNCHNGVLAQTRTITNLYADASGYRAYEEFNFYEITGDAVNWLAKEQIPAISVLLTTHQSVEWDKNKRGIEALFDHYSN